MKKIIIISVLLFSHNAHALIGGDIIGNGCKALNDGEPIYASCKGTTALSSGTKPTIVNRGYYLDDKECIACPFANFTIQGSSTSVFRETAVGMAQDHNTLGITSCFVPPNVPYVDSYGTFVYTSYCTYKN